MRSSAVHVRPSGEYIGRLEAVLRAAIHGPHVCPSDTAGDTPARRSTSPARSIVTISTTWRDSARDRGGAAGTHEHRTGQIVHVLQSRACSCIALMDGHGHRDAG